MATNSESAASGCYGCGGPVRDFGGLVQPAISDRLLGRYVPRLARWWTRCVTCGYVEEVERG